MKVEVIHILRSRYILNKIFDKKYPLQQIA